MARLTEEQKTFIVIELACRRSPSEVAVRVKEEYGIEVSRQQVHQFNPLKIHQNPPAKKWRELFEATREQFDKDRSSISVAIANYRLREIGEVAERAKARGNDVLLLQALKQAAEEAGKAYTNRREVTGKDGKDLPAGAPTAVIVLPAKKPLPGDENRRQR